MPKKGKSKQIKPMKSKPDYKQDLNYNIKKDIKPDKIKPEKVFEGYKKKKPKNVKKKYK
tara:strand:+ start:166 stop:342 length:177 start_codon:yes stop_codon:yes gene_type:complete